MTKNKLYTQDKINITRKKYNDEVVAKTWHYQNKYGFETSPMEGHEFWNNEADSFKHAYMSADLSLKNGDLITKPNDTRKYDGFAEKLFNKTSTPTGLAAGIEHIFTPEEIGKMTPEEFSKNEGMIMEQVKTGKIVGNSSRYNTPGISSSSNNVLYTREDIGNMTTKEFTKHEDAIKQQMKTIGIPYDREVPEGTKTYGKEKSSHNNSSSEDGRWVTINGNHVFIED